MRIILLPILMITITLIFVNTSIASQSNIYSDGNSFFFTCKSPKTVGDDIACNAFTTGMLSGATTTQISFMLKILSPDERKSIENDIPHQSNVAPTSVQKSLMKKYLLYCLPENVTGGQANDIFVQYLENNPRIRQQPVNLLFNMSMQQAFSMYAVLNSEDVSMHVF